MNNPPKREILPGLTISPRTVLTENGLVEFSMSENNGPVILCVHGGLGGFDQARLVVNWLSTQEFTLLCPSRPGYLGTPLESGRTFEQQADLLAGLLDQLGIEKVAVISLSAGGPPAYQFAIRHPDRIWALVAIDSVSGSYHPPEMAGPLTEAIIMSSFGQKIVNMLVKRLPKILIAEVFRGIGYYSKEQRKRQIEYVLNEPEAFTFLKALLGTMNPYAERKEGNLNDMNGFSKLTHLPLEQVRCPSLIIHGTHDADVKFSDGVYAYEHIPGAQRYWIDEGDHLGFWLSPHSKEVQVSARTFLEKYAACAGQTSLSS